MELRHLRYFVTVAEELHITRAAARLHIAQQALSTQIRNLEMELGFDLLLRESKGVTLTAAGPVFWKGRSKHWKRPQPVWKRPEAWRNPS
jgi:DNA-binding transcriptional LysR family regulator